MLTDPPAPDLGAIRARRLALTPDMLEAQGQAVIAADIRALVAAYDAQAREIERLRAEVERLRDATTATS
jgi:cell division protein FtsB